FRSSYTPTTASILRPRAPTPSRGFGGSSRRGTLPGCRLVHSSAARGDGVRGGYAAAEVLRQSQSASWWRGGFFVLFDRSLVWTRESIPVCVSRGWLVH